MPLLRRDASEEDVADLLTQFAAGESRHREEDRERRASSRAAEKRTPTRDQPHYALMRETKLLERLKRWEGARDYLAPYVSSENGHTDGLVISADGDGIDLSRGGSAKILRKATLVHQYVSLRLMGLGRQETLTTCASTFPSSLRTTSDSTIKRYLAEFFEFKGFHETRSGRYVRQNVFHNAAVRSLSRTGRTRRTAST
jgi:hypothetical protein